jgi:hypothetical protein
MPAFLRDGRLCLDRLPLLESLPVAVGVCCIRGGTPGRRSPTRVTPRIRRRKSYRDPRQLVEIGLTRRYAAVGGPEPPSLGRCVGRFSLEGSGTTRVATGSARRCKRRVETGAPHTGQRVPVRGTRCCNEGNGLKTAFRQPP